MSGGSGGGDGHSGCAGRQEAMAPAMVGQGRRDGVVAEVTENAQGDGQPSHRGCRPHLCLHPVELLLHALELCALVCCGRCRLACECGEATVGVSGKLLGPPTERRAFAVVKAAVGPDEALRGAEGLNTCGGGPCTSARAHECTSARATE